MATRHISIFAPPTAPYDDLNWSDTLLARVVRPLVQQHSEIKWFWFLRYEETPREGSDYDFAKIPSHALANGLARMVRFRFEISDIHLSEFEQQGSALIEQAGCFFSDWREYGALGELGGKRFCGVDGHSTPSVERATLVADYLCSVARLVLHALVGPDNNGHYRLEDNGDSENPLRSSFESMHHLFCNMTAVPLAVEMYGPTPFVRTAWMNPAPTGSNLMGHQRIVF